MQTDLPGAAESGQHVHLIRKKAEGKYVLMSFQDSPMIDP